MKTSRGVVLAHTLVMLALLAMIAAMILRWAFARHIMTKRVIDSATAKSAVESTYAKVLACLEGSSMGLTTCDPVTAGVQACLPTTAETGDGTIKPVTVQISGATPLCKITIKFTP